RLFNFVSRNKDAVNDARSVLVLAERVEGGRRVSIQQGDSHREVVHDTTEADDTVTFAVTHAEFPFPSLELIPSIGEFAEVALQTTSEVVVVCVDLECSQTGFRGTVTHTGGELSARRWGARYVKYRRCGGDTARRCIVRRCEWVERVLRRHADTRGANSERLSRVRPDVRRKRCRGQTAIPELPEIFEVGKYGQVLVAEIAIERTIKGLRMGLGNVGSQIGKVEQTFLARRQTTAELIGVLRARELVRSRVRCRCARAASQLREEESACYTCCEVTAAEVERAEVCLIGVVRHINVTRINRGRVVDTCIDNDVCFVIAGTC